MARPLKATVDYFPHSCTHGKTMFILEQKYGNNGYSFWFKLLEMLGSTAGHYIDLNDDSAWEFLQAKTQHSNSSCNEILDLLAKLDAIDSELWEHRVIWSSNFVNGIAQVYSNRRVEIPKRPSFYIQKPCQDDVSTDKNPQTRLNYTKLNNTKLNKSSTYAHFEVFWKAYPKKKSKGQAEKVFARINPDEQLLATMLATIERATTSDDWLKEGGQYIPYPATWLNAKGWEDEIPKVKSKKGAGKLPTAEELEEAWKL